ncbi:MAG: DUF4037 domain-containing protein, partial [Clostridia bacterium]|nr:DUF4037 domain-containing protein [Clostridia bacterium]
MNGLELSKAYFEIYGYPMLREQFPDLLPSLAAGLTGSGSECFGYDDSVSRDHDYEPGFCLFLPDETIIDRSAAFRLERAYAKLPKEFMGLSRLQIQPVGGARHGVIRISDFFMEKVGSPDGALSPMQWLQLPDYALAEAVNGRLFLDSPCILSTIRERLARYPDDVRRKKMAAQILLMAQSGQYNYTRCLRHGETAAAQLTVFEFVRHCLQTIFLLNQTYMPYYKWSFRALRQ